MSQISWKNSSWKQSSLIDDEEVISLSHAKVYVFSDSVLYLGKMNQNTASNSVWEEQLGWFKDSPQYRILETIDGEPMEFEFATLQLVDEVQKCMNKMSNPAQFQKRSIFISMFSPLSRGTLKSKGGTLSMQGVALYDAVAFNSADFATVASNSAFFPFIHPSTVLFFDFCCVKLCFFKKNLRPSTVHNWLMFDTESQLFLTHGQGCGLDSNDGGSLESGPGSRLGDSGYGQETLLERGLGASVSQCLS